MALAPPAAPVTRRPWRPFLRQFVVRLHFYAGVLVAPFLVVAAVTGALYAAAPSVERVVYHPLLTVDPGDRPLPLRDQVRAAAATHPGLPVTAVRPAPGATDSTRVYLADPGLGDDLRRAVFVDPYSGRVLGEETSWLGYLPLSTWLDGLHRHLHLGEPGRLYSEVAASWLWIVALGGLALWCTRRVGERRRGRTARLLTVDRTLTGRARTLSWHGATGVWLLAGLLFLSATGITWSTYAGGHVTQLRAAMNWQRPQVDTVLPADTASPAALDVDYDGVVRAAAHAGVEAPVEVALGEPGRAVGVTEIDAPFRWTTDAAAVDPGDLTVVSAIDYRRDYSVMAKLADWGVRAHMGFLFGWLNQLLLLGVAVGLLTVIVRGYRMWWQRRPLRGTQFAAGRPPTRGAIRHLPRWAVALLVLAAVGVGWFLPLFGIPLAVFCVVDAVVGAVRRRRLATR
jgi:uncharacterized iron-regulated membrane protein